MGRLNELLGAAAAYSRGIAVQFGLQDQEGVPTVAPELVPVTDIHARPEQWALHGGALLIGTISEAGGGAGTRSQVSIEPGVGELVIVERAVIHQAGTSMVFGLSTTPLASSTGNLVCRDARRINTAGASGASGTRIRRQTGVAFDGFASTIMTVEGMGAQEYLDIPLDVVLVSPWSLRFCGASDATAIKRITFFVRARPATERELLVGGL